MQNRDSQSLKSGTVLSRLHMQMQTPLLHYDTKQTHPLRKAWVPKCVKSFICQRDHVVKIEAILSERALTFFDVHLHACPFQRAPQTNPQWRKDSYTNNMFE